MKYLILSLALFAIPSAFGRSKVKLKSQVFDVANFGSIKIKYDVVGEPVGQPERLEIFVKCANSKKENRLQIYRMCLWDDLEFDEQAKLLTIKVANGRVDPRSGNVTCDFIEVKEIDLSTVCSSK